MHMLSSRRIHPPPWTALAAVTALLMVVLPSQTGSAQSGGAIIVTVDGIRPLGVAGLFDSVRPDGYLVAAIEGMQIPGVDVRHFPWTGDALNTYVAATDLQDFLFNAHQDAGGKKLIVVSHSWG